MNASDWPSGLKAICETLPDESVPAVVTLARVVVWVVRLRHEEVGVARLSSRRIGRQVGRCAEEGHLVAVRAEDGESTRSRCRPAPSGVRLMGVVVPVARSLTNRFEPPEYPPEDDPELDAGPGVLS